MSAVEESPFTCVEVGGVQLRGASHHEFAAPGGGDDSGGGGGGSGSDSDDDDVPFHNDPVCVQARNLLAVSSRYGLVWTAAHSTPAWHGDDAPLKCAHTADICAALQDAMIEREAQAAPPGDESEDEAPLLLPDADAQLFRGVRLLERRAIVELVLSHDDVFLAVCFARTAEVFFVGELVKASMAGGALPVNSMWSIMPPAQGAIRALVFSTTQHSQLATLQEGGRVTVFDSSASITHWDVPHATALAWSPASNPSTQLAVAHGAEVTVYDVEQGAAVCTVAAPASMNAITSLSWVTPGHVVFAGHEEDADEGSVGSLHIDHASGNGRAVRLVPGILDEGRDCRLLPLPASWRACLALSKAINEMQAYGGSTDAADSWVQYEDSSGTVVGIGRSLEWQLLHPLGYGLDLSNRAFSEERGNPSPLLLVMDDLGQLKLFVLNDSRFGDRPYEEMRVCASIPAEPPQLQQAAPSPAKAQPVVPPEPDAPASSSDASFGGNFSLGSSAAGGAGKAEWLQGSSLSSFGAAADSSSASASSSAAFGMKTSVGFGDAGAGPSAAAAGASSAPSFSMPSSFGSGFGNDDASKPKPGDDAAAGASSAPSFSMPSSFGSGFGNDDAGNPKPGDDAAASASSAPSFSMPSSFGSGFGNAATPAEIAAKSKSKPKPKPDLPKPDLKPAAPGTTTPGRRSPRVPRARDTPVQSGTARALDFSAMTPASPAPAKPKPPQPSPHRRPARDVSPDRYGDLERSVRNEDMLERDFLAAEAEAAKSERAMRKGLMDLNTLIFNLRERRARSVKLLRAVREGGDDALFDRSGAEDLEALTRRMRGPIRRRNEDLQQLSEAVAEVTRMQTETRNQVMYANELVEPIKSGATSDKLAEMALEPEAQILEDRINSSRATLKRLEGDLREHIKSCRAESRQTPEQVFLAKRAELGRVSTTMNHLGQFAGRLQSHIARQEARLAELVARDSESPRRDAQGPISSLRQHVRWLSSPGQSGGTSRFPRGVRPVMSAPAMESSDDEDDDDDEQEEQEPRLAPFDPTDLTESELNTSIRIPKQDLSRLTEALSRRLASSAPATDEPADAAAEEEPSFVSAKSVRSPKGKFRNTGTQEQDAGMGNRPYRARMYQHAAHMSETLDQMSPPLSPLEPPASGFGAAGASSQLPKPKSFASTPFKLSDAADVDKAPALNKSSIIPAATQPAATSSGFSSGAFAQPKTKTDAAPAPAGGKIDANFKFTIQKPGKGPTEPKPQANVKAEKAEQPATAGGFGNFSGGFGSFSQSGSTGSFISSNMGPTASKDKKKDKKGKKKDKKKKDKKKDQSADSAPEESLFATEPGEIPQWDAPQGGGMQQPAFDETASRQEAMRVLQMQADAAPEPFDDDDDSDDSTDSDATQSDTDGYMNQGGFQQGGFQQQPQQQGGFQQQQQQGGFQQGGFQQPQQGGFQQPQQGGFQQGGFQQQPQQPQQPQQQQPQWGMQSGGMGGFQQPPQQQPPQQQMGQWGSPQQGMPMQGQGMYSTPRQQAPSGRPRNFAEVLIMCRDQIRRGQEQMLSPKQLRAVRETSVDLQSKSDVYLSALVKAFHQAKQLDIEVDDDHGVPDEDAARGGGMPPQQQQWGMQSGGMSGGMGGYQQQQQAPPPPQQQQQPQWGMQSGGMGGFQQPPQQQQQPQMGQWGSPQQGMSMQGQGMMPSNPMGASFGSTSGGMGMGGMGGGFANMGGGNSFGALGSQGGGGGGGWASGGGGGWGGGNFTQPRG